MAENTMLKESLKVMTLQQDSPSSRMYDLESQECKTQLLLSNAPETRNEGTMTFFLAMSKKRRKLTYDPVTLHMHTELVNTTKTSTDQF